jgi:cysteine desulfurase
VSPVYLDWNATTPPLPEVGEAVAHASVELWGNAASAHSVGSQARRALEEARETVAGLMGCRPFDLVFTSGGTEANNLALRSLVADVRHVLCSRLEHPSVIRVVEAVESACQVHWIPVDEGGRVDIEVISRTLREVVGDAVVVIQAVNHETGVIQPVEEVIEVAHEKGAMVHVDAVQGVGKLEGSPWRDADTVALTAHKIRGPKGIGALVGGACQSVRPLLLGGPQERKLRPGTVSVPLAVGFGVAASWARTSPARYADVRVLRDRLEHALLSLGAQRNGSREPRVPHVLNVSFEGLRGDELVAALDVEGICVSSGSACSAGSPEASSVVAAMLGPKRSAGAIRASLGDVTTLDDIDRAIEAFRRVIGRAGFDG